MSDQIQRVDAAIAAAVRPVLEELAELERQIEAKELELTTLKDARTRAKKIAHLLDPEQPPGKGQKTNRKPAKPGTKSSSDYNIKEETVEKVYAYLAQHVPAGETFYATGIHGNGLDFVSEPTLNVALRRLHDQGRLRLDSVGNGGRRNYTLT